MRPVPEVAPVAADPRTELGRATDIEDATAGVAEAVAAGRARQRGEAIRRRARRGHQAVPPSAYRRASAMPISQMIVAHAGAKPRRVLIASIGAFASALPVRTKRAFGHSRSARSSIAALSHFPRPRPRCAGITAVPCCEMTWGIFGS